MHKHKTKNNNNKTKRFRKVNGLSCHDFHVCVNMQGAFKLRISPDQTLKEVKERLLERALEMVMSAPFNVVKFDSNAKKETADRHALLGAVPMPPLVDFQVCVSGQHVRHEVFTEEATASKIFVCNGVPVCIKTYNPFIVDSRVTILLKRGRKKDSNGDVGAHDIKKLGTWVVGGCSWCTHVDKNKQAFVLYSRSNNEATQLLVTWAPRRDDVCDKVTVEGSGISPGDALRLDLEPRSEVENPLPNDLGGHIGCKFMDRSAASCLRCKECQTSRLIGTCVLADYDRFVIGKKTIKVVEKPRLSDDDTDKELLVTKTVSLYPELEDITGRK